MAMKISNSITFSEHKKIIEVEEWYLATHKSKGVTIDPSEGWTKEIQPMDKNNKYLWNYERTIYSLGDPQVSDPVIIGVFSDSGDGKTSYFHIKYSEISPATDQSLTETPSKYIGTYVDYIEKDSDKAADYLWSQFMGNNGTDGHDGQNGAGIHRFRITYAMSSDGINHPLDEEKYWQNTIPEIPEGNFLWVRTETFLTVPEGSTVPERTVSYSVSRNGKNGANGIDSYLHIKYSNDGGLTFTPVDPDSGYPTEGEKPGKYIGQYTNDEKEDSLQVGDYTWSKLEGSDGLGIASSVIGYYVDNQGAKIPENVQWSETFPSAPLTDTQYLWIKTTITYTNKEIKPTITYSVSKNGTNGKDGTDGNNGDTSYIHIKYSNDGGATFTERSDPHDETTIGETPGTYLGQYSDFIAQDEYIDTSKYRWSLIKGADGTPGDPGIGVESAVVYYQVKTEPMTGYPIVGWKTEFPTDIKDGDYLWTKTEITYTGGINPSQSYSVSRVGYDGSSSYIHIKYSNDDSPNKKFTDIKLPDYPIAGEQPGKYIGQYTDHIEIDSDDSSKYKWSLLEGTPGKDGDAGIGISRIINYYTLTREDFLPENPDWKEIPSTMTPEFKFLWNYEDVIYTDESHHPTDPAIIGVYGDSGDTAVTFNVYSTDGFIFHPDLDSIQLQIAAFKGADPIVSSAIYQWEYWDKNLNNGLGEYVPIGQATSNKVLLIKKSDTYALLPLKCTMTLENKKYFTYVNLSESSIYYTSVINFFEGNNVFNIHYPYIIAYVSLYKNNKLEETVATDRYYVGNNVYDPTTNQITSNLQGSFTSNDLNYFVYQGEDKKYKIVLGRYKESITVQSEVSDSNIRTIWTKEDQDYKYEYGNNIWSTENTNIIILEKNDVSRSKELIFNIYQKKSDETGIPIKDNSTFISTTSATILDLNDPIVSAKTPEGAEYGQLWLDISQNPYILKIFVQTEKGNGKWEIFSQSKGTTIYTSRPNSYTKGDLWVLADGEICKEFKAGSMLKARYSSMEFDEADWIDANTKDTETLNDIRQYFSFSADQGMKIGQKDEKFYMRLTSQELGFYDNSDINNPDQKVVYISNTTANINRMTVKEDADFDCNAVFRRQVRITNAKLTASGTEEVNASKKSFIWKIEDNGSLSLALFD